DSKVEVFLIQQGAAPSPERRAISGNDPYYYAEQIPSDKWEVTKGNYYKLKVGMTLKELQDIIGAGKLLDGPESFMKPDWQRAVKEDRVYWWHGENVRPLIYARFSDPPAASAATKVEALLYRER